MVPEGQLLVDSFHEVLHASMAAEPAVVVAAKVSPMRAMVPVLMTLKYWRSVPNAVKVSARGAVLYGAALFVVATAPHLAVLTVLGADAACAVPAASAADSEVHSIRAVTAAAAPALMLGECTLTGISFRWWWPYAGFRRRSRSGRRTGPGWCRQGPLR